MIVKNFLDIPSERIVYRGEHFFAIYDGYPVSPGHSLIVSNEIRATYFDLEKEELLELPDIIGAVKVLIEKEHAPDGYNIGMNCGEIAGQTVMHFHCHVIPRYKGDMKNPRGGVRHVIPEKGNY